MTYLITFLEGLITFISPCLLPMLPVYAAYFAGGRKEDNRSPFWKALAFVLGFTITFAVLGAFAGTLGGLLRRYQTGVNLVCGFMVILFGLNFLGVIRLRIFRGTGPLYRCLPRLSFDAGLFPGFLDPGNPSAYLLFCGAGNPFPHQCCADTEIKDNL